MEIKLRYRLKRATRFFGVSLGISLVAFIFHMFDDLFNNPSFTVDWLRTYLEILVMGTVLVWLAYKISPETWRTVSSMIGWKDEDD